MHFDAFGYGVSNVSHAEGLDLAVLLELHREVEGVVGDELEDVEAAAEVDAPAGVGDDRAVVDRGVELHVEVDAGDRCAPA